MRHPPDAPEPLSAPLRFRISRLDRSLQADFGRKSRGSRRPRSRAPRDLDLRLRERGIKEWAATCVTVIAARSAPVTLRQQAGTPYANIRRNPLRQTVPRMSLAEYMSLLRRRGWILVLCALLGLAAAGAVSAAAAPHYRARHAISMTPAEMDWRIRDLTKELAFNSAERFPLPALAAGVSADTGLPQSEVEDALAAAFDNVTLIITLEAHHMDADTARALADSAVDRYLEERIAFFEAQEFTGSIDLQRVSANPAIQKLAPNTRVNALAGFFLGLAAGASVLLFVLWREEESLARPEVVRRALGLPVLGQLALD